MFMGIDMILAVFIIAGTFGAEAEGKFRVRLTCPSADGTFVFSNALGIPHLFLIGKSSFCLTRGIFLHIPCGKEEDEEIQYGQNNADRMHPRIRSQMQGKMPYSHNKYSWKG